MCVHVMYYTHLMTIFMCSKFERTKLLSVQICRKESTLPSILQGLMNGFNDKNCYEIEPSHSLIKQAKKAMWRNNKEHSMSSL